jgi:phosphatidylserine/phosphatidylglycerophosphate/cardiolipin synthase-like enzyme
MTAVVARAFASPTIVLLAFDWPAASRRKDFLGFAIRRSPGFGGARESWLPNRVGFDGPPHEGEPSSDRAPIQKFMWWDARIEDGDASRRFAYTIVPVVGRPDAPTLVTSDATTLRVACPSHRERGIGTWFNRAVVSSQAFSQKLRSLGVHPFSRPPPATERVLRAWLANGIDRAIPEFLASAPRIAGAIYHLTDTQWVIPALARRARGTTRLVYDDVPHTDPLTHKPTRNPNAHAVEALGDVTFHPRRRTRIMHNKVLVALNARGPLRVLCGSANFTSEGLTSQANVIHTFDSPDLARAYHARIELLADDPQSRHLRDVARWSEPADVGGARVRVFFSPEPTRERVSIDTIVRSIRSARSSVLFCLFMPTDRELRDQCFRAGDAGRMMFGLVNLVRRPRDPNATRSDAVAAVEIFHRSQHHRDVVGQEWYGHGTTPQRFLREWQLYPGEERPDYPPVLLHHKFVVIDAETDDPVIYTGSANMSESSLHANDENLLEIRGAPQLAHAYLAEFFRLYEHYRARAAWNRFERVGPRGYALARDGSWAARHLRASSPEGKARRALVRGGK